MYSRDKFMRTVTTVLIVLLICLVSYIVIFWDNLGASRDKRVAELNGSVEVASPWAHAKGLRVIEKSSDGFYRITMARGSARYTFRARTSDLFVNIPIGAILDVDYNTRNFELGTIKISEEVLQ